jgi:CheY-like chemotaxis protein
VASPSFDDLLGELRAEYLRAAPERLLSMQSALDTLARDARNLEALAQLRLTFHAWAGNGRTYGFPEVTRLGLEGDVQCAARLREGPPRAAEILGWRTLAEAISRALEAPPTGTRVRAPREAAAPCGQRILCMDDDPCQCAFLRAVLCSAGYEVRTCGVPERFLDDQAAFGPDLVVMDIVLPGTNGYELARALRARAPAVPVLFMSTTDPAAGEEILRKPAEPATLVAAVRRRLAPLEPSTRP